MRCAIRGYPEDTRRTSCGHLRSASGRVWFRHRRQPRRPRSGLPDALRQAHLESKHFEALSENKASPRLSPRRCEKPSTPSANVYDSRMLSRLSKASFVCPPTGTGNLANREWRRSISCARRAFEVNRIQVNAGFLHSRNARRGCAARLDERCWFVRLKVPCRMDHADRLILPTQKKP